MQLSQNNFKNKKSEYPEGYSDGPSGETWTHDPLTPSQVRYQLRYTRFSIRCSRSQLSYNSTPCSKMQHLFSFFSKFFLVRNFGISVDKPPEDMLLYHKCSRGGQPPVMERCPSGWRNRSWKPATRKCPWVRIPLSPPHFLISYDLQKYPRGRRGSPAKGVGWIKPPRGFKSLLLRHKVATIRIF